MLDDKLFEEYVKSVLNFSVEYNPHKICYQSISKYIESNELTENDFPNKDMQLCIENNLMWNIHCFPKNPIGFYSIYGYDLKNLLNIVTATIEK